MVALGTTTEAVLVSDVDGFCVTGILRCPKLGDFRTNLNPCDKRDGQGYFLDKRDGTICSSSGTCLTPKDNSNQVKAEILHKAKALRRGSVWNFKDGNIVNRYGLCLEREKPKNNKPSELIQAKCDPANLWQKFHFEKY